MPSYLYHNTCIGTDTHLMVGFELHAHSCSRSAYSSPTRLVVRCGKSRGEDNYILVVILVLLFIYGVSWFYYLYKYNNNVPSTLLTVALNITI